MMSQSRDNFDCIIPAAGASSRMGAFKPLLPFPSPGGDHLVEATVDAARRAGCRVILVVGNRGEEVSALFAGDPGIVITHNASWESGMLGSIRTGMARAVGEAFFVTPADMPLIPSAAYLQLEEAWRGDRKEGLELAALFASFQGRRGHPVLLPSPWASEISELDPGSRLCDFLSSRPRKSVETGDEAVLLDADLPAEYRSLLDERGGGGRTG